MHDKLRLYDTRNPTRDSVVIVVVVDSKLLYFTIVAGDPRFKTVQLKYGHWRIIRWQQREMYKQRDLTRQPRIRRFPNTIARLTNTFLFVRVPLPYTYGKLTPPHGFYPRICIQGPGAMANPEILGP